MSVMVTNAEEQIFAEIQYRLAAKFAAIPPAQVATVVSDSRKLFLDSKIRDFIPLLVERRANVELLRMSKKDLLSA